MKQVNTAILETLPSSSDALVDAASDKVAGTLYVRTAAGSVRLRPGPAEPLLFGRNRDAVHICVGGDDRTVSRVQGSVTYGDGVWWLANRGQRRLQLPRGRELVRESEPWALPLGHSAVFLRTSDVRVHTLEFYVSAGTGIGPQPEHRDTTNTSIWRLSRAERLVVVASAQRYLLMEEDPKPWLSRAVAELLPLVAPDEHWDTRRVTKLLDDVRLRLAEGGVPGLARPVETGQGPVKHNLIAALLASGTVDVRDLQLLDD